jgi:serine/threonine protein kinase
MKEKVFETTFSKYIATEVIGEGGSGRVYKANDENGETFAIKLLDPKKATMEKRKRFQNEVAFCMRRQLTNIITIIDHGIFIDREINEPFYVMPFFESSLRKLISKQTVKQIDPGKVFPLFNQILNGTEAAHLLGVVHRDLKPENILYDPAKDYLVVADFGIASFGEEELYTLVETDPRARLANFLYAAPEQKERGRQVDHRADIYALGLMLNEMFTMKIPHGTGYKSIKSVAPEYGYLDEIVDLMMRQSPQERPESIEMIKKELIGRKNEFVILQRLSDLKKTVIPVTEIDDPLILDPPRLEDFDFDKGKLTLTLNQPVNSGWVWSFKNMIIPGYRVKDPHSFSFQDKKATVNMVNPDPNQVQAIIDNFKTWLPMASRAYEENLLERQKEEEIEERHRLERQIEEEENRRRIIENVRI